MVETINSFWKYKRVLITGCSGFLGSHLAASLLSKRATVVGLIHKHHLPVVFFPKLAKTHQIRGSITNVKIITSVIQKQSIEIIFHLAAQPIVGNANTYPLKTFEPNIRGSWTLLEAARHSPTIKSIVVASSDKAYGDHKDLPYTENSPLIGRHPYDVSKSCTDLLASAYFHTYKTPAIILRSANFFGGGDMHFNRLIPGTIQSLLHEEQPIIRSDGTYLRDYVYIEDVVDAFLLAAEKGYKYASFHGQAFNITNEVRLNVVEVVEKITNILGSSLSPIIINNATNEIKNQYLSNKKAKRLLGWEPAVSFDEGLRRTIVWYENYFKRKHAKT